MNGHTSCSRSGLLLLLLSLQGQAAQSVVIVHVNVVDVRAATIHADQTVVIRAEHIEEIGRTAAIKGAKHIDGRGKYLIPGLWDMYVHLGAVDLESFQIYLANGITGLREMAPACPISRACGSIAQKSLPGDWSARKLWRRPKASRLADLANHRHSGFRMRRMHG